MARMPTISYGPRLTASGKERPIAEFYLATCNDRMQFYLFDEPRDGQDNSWSLIDELDRSQLLAAGDRDTAKTWAKRLGLKSWTYVRV